MKNQNKAFVKIGLAVACCLGLGLSKSEGQVPFIFMYNGAQFGGTAIFPNYTAGANCPANHKDPHGNNYVHCHPIFDFPLNNVPAGGQHVQVTAAMSDLAWSNSYTGYTYVSGSTFALNCYAFADNAPVPTDDSAWSQWTTPYTECSNPTNTTSYLIHSRTHCVVFVEAGGDEDCYVKSTIEKNASGPVWSAVNIPHGSLPSNDALGQNIK